MGIQTLKTFRTGLQFTLGNRGFEDNQLSIWINVGLADLISQIEFEEEEFFFVDTVPAGQGFFLPANGLMGIIGMVNKTDKIAMTRIDQGGFDRLDAETKGEPKFWMRRGNETIFIWPTPEVDTDIQMDTQSVEQVLLGDTETTNLQSMWDRAVHLLAAAHALTDLEEAERSIFFFNGASRYIAKRIDLRKVDGRATGEPVKVIDSFEQLRVQRQFDRELG